MPDYETIVYEERDRVAWVTLNRPEVYNAFNVLMQDELRNVWTSLRRNDDVRVAVLTGAGEKAFCTGADRNQPLSDTGEPVIGSGSTPFMFDDPGRSLGPKQNDLWKPVIAAINGMACGGAFYLLGEADIIIAADHALFFDPHVTYGITAAFEPIHMLQKMPLGEILRMSLLGNHERMTAQRAHQVGLVSDVVPLADLHAAAEWVATAIASAPTLPVQATLRAIWSGLELSRQQALDNAYAFTELGNDPASMAEGQAAFTGGHRIEWRKR